MGRIRSAHRVESWLSGLGSTPSLNPTRFNSFLIELGFGHSCGSRHLPCLFPPPARIPLQASPYHDTAASDQQLRTNSRSTRYSWKIPSRCLPSSFLLLLGPNLSSEQIKHALHGSSSWLLFTLSAGLHQLYNASWPRHTPPHLPPHSPY